MAARRASKSSEQQGDGEKEAFTKYPMKRLELSIKKFIRVVSVDLERLKKHTVNISRLTKFEDWNGLHKEQVNATRTVQQINVNIMEIERTRKQVIDDDLKLFDEQVDPIKTQAVEAMAELVAFIGQGPQPSPATSSKKQEYVDIGTGDVDLNALLQVRQGSSGRVPTTQTSADASHPLSATWSKKQFSLDEQLAKNRSSRAGKADSFATWRSSSLPSDKDSPPEDATDSIDAVLAAEGSDLPGMEMAPLLTTSLHVAPQNSDASASWEELQESIMDLNSLVHDFATKVEEQGESIDSIDDNINSADQDVVEGTTHLAKASKYKAAMFPVLGAVVGGVIGGPIGLVAGLKIGGVAGVIGGTVGFAGGRLIKKRQDKITNIEMANMESKRSQSMLEISPEQGGEEEETPPPTSPNGIDTETKSKSQSLGNINFGKVLSYFSSSATSSDEKL